MPIQMFKPKVLIEGLRYSITENSTYYLISQRVDRFKYIPMMYIITKLVSVAHPAKNLLKPNTIALLDNAVRPLPQKARI